MGIFSKPKPPKPIDVNASIGKIGTQATSDAFKQAAFNKTNQTNQFGNTSNYSQTGTDAQGNPIFAQQTQLGGTGQGFAGGFSGLGMDALGKMQDKLNNPMDPAQAGMQAFGHANDLWSSINEPRLQRQTDATENKLRNQGFDPSSQGFRDAMSDLSLQQDQGRNAFQLNAQNQMYQQAADTQKLGDAELSQFGSPGVNFGNNVLNSGFQSVPGINVGNVDTQGLINSNQQQQMELFKQKKAQQNAMYTGLATIAGGALGGPIGGAMAGKMFGGGSVDPISGY